MPKFKERQRRVVTSRIQRAGEAEQRGIESFRDAGIRGLGEGPTIADIMGILQRSPQEDIDMFREAVFGQGLTRGMQPALEDAVRFAEEQAAGRGLSRGTIRAGLTAQAVRPIMGQALMGAQSQFAGLLPEALMQRRRDAQSLLQTRGQSFDVASAALQRDLQERSMNRTTTERTMTPQRSFLSRVLGAGLGVGLGALTGGLGTAAAGGISGLFGGGDNNGGGGGALPMSAVMDATTLRGPTMRPQRSYNELGGGVAQNYRRPFSVG
jgi:hypothetical protein